MTKKAKTGFSSDFRRFFLRGLATLLPTILTIVLLVKCFEFIQENISVHINNGVIHLVVLTTNDYPKLNNDDRVDYLKELNLLGQPVDEEMKVDMRRWKLRRQWGSGPQSLIGFCIAIMLVYILGRLLASFLGRKVWQAFESMVQQVPGFKQVYPYIKQVTTFLFGENKIEFSRVVAVPYPREGIWSLGLVTGAGFRFMNDKLREEFLTVFIPSSPTPITGYVIHVKKNEAIDLPITIEEALRFTVSAGVIVPDHQSLPTQRVELVSGSAAASTSGEKENQGDKK